MPLLWFLNFWMTAEVWEPDGQFCDPSLQLCGFDFQVLGSFWLTKVSYDKLQSVMIKLFFSANRQYHWITALVNFYLGPIRDPFIIFVFPVTIFPLSEILIFQNWNDSWTRIFLTQPKHGTAFSECVWQYFLTFFAWNINIFISIEVTFYFEVLR